MIVAQRCWRFHVVRTGDLSGLDMLRTAGPLAHLSVGMHIKPEEPTLDTDHDLGFVDASAAAFSSHSYDWPFAGGAFFKRL